MTNPTNDDSDRRPSSPPPSDWGQPPAPPPQWTSPTSPPTVQFGQPPGQWNPAAGQHPPSSPQPPAQSGSQWPAQHQQYAPNQYAQPYAGGSGSPWAGQPGQPGQPGGPEQGGPRRTKNNKKLIAIIAAVVVAALVGGGLFFLLSGDDITYQGRDIVEPEIVLTDAESRLDGIVEERNGATNDQTSCYFVVKNAETTDIEDGLVCGPVLFVDGDEGQPYLTFPIEGSAGDGDATLTVAAEPVSPEPSELANPDLLRRPDGGSPPEGSGGLAAPEPPRAEEGLFTDIPGEGIDLESTPATARIGSPTASIDVTGLGTPERYGQGDDARRPAEGEKFIAFELTLGPPEVGPTGDFTVAVQAGEDDPIPLPGDAPPQGEPVVLAISVPEDTDDVDLVVTEGALVQRLSLITGEPDPGNVAVWQRANRSQSLTFAQATTLRASQPGFVTEDLPCTVNVGGVQLDYFAGLATRAPSAPDRAFLVLNAELNLDGQIGQLDAVFWSLTLPDGTVVPAVDLIDDPVNILIAFDVPANFTEGTVNFGGVGTTSGGLTFDSLGAFVSVPISIPEG